VKILIIQTAFPGDVILSTALAEALHHHLPNADVHYLVRKGNESLFYRHPFIKKVWVWDKNHKKLIGLFRLIRHIRREKYEEVINIHRFFSSGLLTVTSGASHTTGFTANPLSFLFTYRHAHVMGNGMHEVARNHRLIIRLTGPQIFKPALYPSEEDYQAINKYVSRPYVCMAPASVWFTKQWPASRWIELIGLINDRYRIFLIGGQQDMPLLESIRLQSLLPVTNLAGQLTFLQSAALMKQAVMNYVNDSAPLHLASAVNAPVTAFFLSTHPSFGFGPLSDNARIFSAQPSPDCRPCGSHGKRTCPKKHFLCAWNIPVNEKLLP
jgi:heptosyltransferase-2